MLGGRSLTIDNDDKAAADTATIPWVIDRPVHINIDPIECTTTNGNRISQRVLAFQVDIPSWESTIPDVRRDSDNALPSLDNKRPVTDSIVGMACTAPL